MRRFRWIALAALLLAAAGLLLSLGEREPAPPRARVEFPRWMSGDEYQRRRRATLVVPPARAQASVAPAPPAGREPERRDPFLVALPVKPGSPVVVLEANALRHSRLGERFVACLQAQDPALLDQLQRDSGIDPLKDIDRVAFLGDSMVVSGFFDRVRWDQLRSQAEPYGEAGRIYHEPHMVLGAWRDQLMVLSDRPEAIRTAIDQLEGRAQVPETGIPDEMAFGEIYGLIPGTAARWMLGTGQQALADRITSLASRIELHVDAMQDVAAVVRIRGEDAAGLSDLARSLGAALAVARVKAQATNDERLAELLENAEVHPGAGELSLQLALPADRLEAWFEGCEGRGSAPAP
jgi:hypothetical protein